MKIPGEKPFYQQSLFIPPLKYTWKPFPFTHLPWLPSSLLAAQQLRGHSSTPSPIHSAYSSQIKLKNQFLIIFLCIVLLQWLFTAARIKAKCTATTYIGPTYLTPCAFSLSLLSYWFFFSVFNSPNSLSAEGLRGCCFLSFPFLWLASFQLSGWGLDTSF